jgi:hypothetical protein
LRGGNSDAPFTLGLAFTTPVAPLAVRPLHAMHTFIRHVAKVVLIPIALAVSGCALTTPVQKRVDGYTSQVKDDSKEGYHDEKHEPQPAYIPLLFITVPVDIATFPIQLPFVVCIWHFYDIHPL